MKQLVLGALIIWGHVSFLHFLTPYLQFHRAKDVLVPRGSTIIESEDKLLVFADESGAERAKAILR
jgi:Trk K+ transport system NAD-binding subunit